MDRYIHSSNSYSSNCEISMIDNDSNNFYRSLPTYTPLTKQVDQLAYEIPRNKYAKNPWSCAPEFLKVFSDVRAQIGQQACFDCILLGSPRPKVCWLFNNEKMKFDDVQIDDTADLCRLTIPNIQHYHYGTYTVLCENEVGRTISSANLIPIYD
ncbi:Muscle M-line assembly protein [Dirofilaria immitis]|nr:Striated muscle-specific serine/threonine-protein kinase [Dirofilaria immitis]